MKTKKIHGIDWGIFVCAISPVYLETKMTKKEEKDNKSELSEDEKYQKVQILRDTITSAEKTIQSAKAMLLQLEGKKKTGRKRKVDFESEGNVITGTFDGQVMIGSDGKQYPVLANYASKSKLVEGDMLKLTITPDGSFIYKQIGPVERKNVIGIVSQDEAGNYYIIADGKPYKVLLASVTYFKAEPGDEVVITIPNDGESTWAAIENVLQKSENSADTEIKKTKEMKKSSSDEVVDEWSSDIEQIKEEIKKSQIP